MVVCILGSHKKAIYSSMCIKKITEEDCTQLVSDVSIYG